MASLLGLHSREQRFLFGYLLIATGALVGLASWVLYTNYRFPSVNAIYLADKIKREQQLFDRQQPYIAQLDSAHRAIATYRPEVTALFVETDIENQLSEIRQLYTGNDTTAFFRAFDQAANFYQMLYRDKKLLASKKANARLFAKQLEACTVGVQPRGPVEATPPRVVFLPTTP